MALVYKKYVLLRKERGEGDWTGLTPPKRGWKCLKSNRATAKNRYFFETFFFQEGKRVLFIIFVPELRKYICRTHVECFLWWFKIILMWEEVTLLMWNSFEIADDRGWFYTFDPSSKSMGWWPYFFHFNLLSWC